MEWWENLQLEVGHVVDEIDPEGLLGSEEKPIGGRNVPEWLRMTHIDISRISCAFAA